MPGRLRILVLNLRDISSPAAGGAEEHLHQLFRRIAARGHAVTLHAGSYPGAPDTELIDGIRVVRRGNRFTTAAWSILFYLMYRRNFDVIVDYTCQLHFLTPLYVRQPRVAMALHIVSDVYTHDLPLKLGYGLMAWEAISLRLFYGKEYFAAICASTAEELERFGIRRERIKVIHGGRREPGLPEGIPKTAYPSLVYHGRLRQYKRVDWLLRALPDIRRQVPGTRLHLVGTGDQEARLRRLAEQLQLGDAVVFHGWLPDSAHWGVVGSAWVHLQPSLKEGWSLSVMEAAQLGVPTVATRTAGLRDVVVEGQTGELFDTADLGDLVRKTVNMLQDHERRHAMGAQARRWADSFSWDRSSVELEEMLTNQMVRRAGLGRRATEPAAEPALEASAEVPVGAARQSLP
jgi:glycosyltransferase involved in cell wall biosynthesis